VVLVLLSMCRTSYGRDRAAASLEGGNQSGIFRAVSPGDDGHYGHEPGRGHAERGVALGPVPR
jgi:hypothetical protein